MDVLRSASDNTEAVTIANNQFMTLQLHSFTITRTNLITVGNTGELWVTGEDSSKFGFLTRSGGDAIHVTGTGIYSQDYCRVTSTTNAALSANGSGKIELNYCALVSNATFALWTGTSCSSTITASDRVRFMTSRNSEAVQQ